MAEIEARGSQIKFAQGDTARKSQIWDFKQVPKTAVSALVLSPHGFTGIPNMAGFACKLPAAIQALLTLVVNTLVVNAGGLLTSAACPGYL